MKPLWSRFGIHTGRTLVGNLGLPEWNSSHSARRLEGVNKICKTDIIVSSDTRDAARQEFLFRPLGSVSEKGKMQEVEIYELIESLNDASEHQKYFYSQFLMSLSHLQRSDFSGAKSLFEKLRISPPSDYPT
jgi:adenylate cyclase